MLGSSGPPMASMEQQRLYDPYTMTIDPTAGHTPVSRMPPPLATQYPLPLGPVRPQPPHGHGYGQFTSDQEMPLVLGPGGHQSQYLNGLGGCQLQPFGISRPISPVQVGSGGPGVPPAGVGKQWLGDSRIPPLHNSSGKQGSEYGWMGMPESRDERDREKREKDQERERAKMRERNERERDREQYEMEPQERNYLIQQQHRHAPPHQHSHAATASSPHQHQPPALPHHHRPHHYHVVHHHHSQPSGNGGSQTIPALSVPATGSAPSPRARDYEPSRSHPSDVLNLSSSKPGSSGGQQAWKRDEPLPSEYRDIRARQGSRPSSTHPGPVVYDERDRPLSTPFAMPPSSQTMPTVGPPQNGQSSSSGHSPRMPSWSDDHGARMTSSSFATGPLGRGSPIGLSPPRSRPPAPRSPSTSLSFPGPMRSPQRYAQSGPMTEPPPLHSLPPLNHGGSSLSTPSSPGLKSRRPLSPPLGKPGMSAGVASPIYSPPPRLVGPGRTSTPTTLGPPTDIHNNVHPSTTAPQNTSVFSRNASPLMPFNSPTSHPGQSAVAPRPPPNVNNTMLPAPQMSAVQIVDGP